MNSATFITKPCQGPTSAQTSPPRLCATRTIDIFFVLSLEVASLDDLLLFLQDGFLEQDSQLDT